MNQRLGRAETWSEWGEAIPLDDPDGWELTIYKEGQMDADFSDRTLPRTFVGRSRLERVSFHNSDLHNSRLCWNDFNECDFSDADLSHSDLRASVYRRCSFARCCLVAADLRRASFDDCDWSGADLRAAKGSRAQSKTLNLSEQQTRQVKWQRGEGAEPEGG